MTVPWQDRPKTDPRAYVTFSPDGQRAVTLNDGNTTLQNWDLNTGKRAGSAVSAASFGGEKFSSLGGGYFLVEGEPLQLWNAFTNAVRSLPVSVSSDSVIHLSDDGDILALADRAGYSVYDLRTGRKLAEVVYTDLNRGYLLRFDPFGRGLIYLSSNEDSTFKFTFLDVETGEKIDQISVVPIEFIGALIDPDHTLAVPEVCLVYSIQITMYCLHGRLELWDAKTMRPLGILDELSTSLTSEDVRENYLPPRAEFKPMALVGEERRLIAWSPRGYASWDVDPESWVRRACRRAGRNFSQAEWGLYFPDEEYRQTCI
jgi:WD40 repeat protein